ncbi:hypothetical protein QBC46DRAFT_398993 [Diplogelasinospora grovesii]|uniref:Uncharacterized protein n=1 Tax=Diplogelasinospora grovesii TaxID=303347 RepID=A0AAN6RZE6_9PEZI|nr:hypothetical protein QBC46DRAFT_398993 [Diplogelasinospora grovesii]
MSLSEASARDSVVSAVPRHMKSTSSRFSFDMIGAAKQERLLEERHRQRELEKKATDGAQGPRESGYDEFDEDAFDYDAMMDDDGLEERIPGVNADLEEEEDEEDYEAAFDPDNDQENFAGFTFQRSNPTSTLASPLPPGTGMLATPRDSNGNVIGFAETKDATPGLPPSPLPTFGSDPATAPGPDDAVLGLGIQELHIQDQVAQDEAVTAPQDDVQQEAAATVDPAPSTKRVNDDDIYFDDGLADELDFEHDGTVFDESIFDNNDTDRYGRPIPGAFAQAAQAMRAAQQQQVASRRESDMTSRLSAQSGISQSTAHTSLSADLQLQQLTTTEKEKEQQDPRQDPQPGPLSAQKTWSDTASRMAIPGQDLAYQAALAEAAQKAAASGKFRRDSSPPLPSELTIITSPTDPGESRNHPDPHVDASLEDYEAEDDDEQYGNELDDFDFDDEAIIAEANASALASDSDGWYGHEFGFYSAPPPQPHHGLSHQSSSSSSSSIALSAENLYQYANGGYFGPGGQGLGRSTSGRVVSREPNLTPITERSEYSNRNSIMSLALPPPIGSESNRNSVPLQSPGLAQLAMMADDDNMSLSALLKLRSKAWGGSQASLASSRDGSPRSERVAAPAGGDPTGSPWGTGSGVFSPGFTGPPGGPSVAGSQQQQQHGRRNSAFSIWSTSDAAAGASGSGSPTLTNQQLPMVTFPLMSSPPMVQGIMASPPFSPGNGVNAINPSSGGIIMGGPLIVGPPLSPSPFASSPPQQQQQFSAAAAPTLPPLPPISPGLFLPALGLGGGGGPCSPVLEAEEATSAAFAPAAPSEQQQQQQQQPNINVMSSHSHLPSPPASSSPPLPLSPVQQCQQPRNNTVGTATVNVVGRPGSSQGLGRGHRHKGSADSISYTKEEITDYSSGTGNGGGREKTRWVMERRRTAESGEVEILGREVIEDGRI